MIFTPNNWLVETVGWTLLHSLWQGAIVALALFIVLRLMKSATSNARYVTACAALCLLPALVAVTFARLSAIDSASGKSSGATVKDEERYGEGAFPGQRLKDSFELKNIEDRIWQNASNDDALPRIGFAWLEKQVDFLLPFLVWLWFIGVILMMLRLGGGFWGVRTILARNNEPVAGEWLGKFDRLCGELKIKRAVELIESSIVATPLTVRWLKPVVIVPASAFLQLTPGELEAILKHELAHIRRYDYLVNVMQSMIETLFFYNPAVWWVSAAIRREREFACDDVVLESSGDKFIYARALASLEQYRRLTIENQSQITLAASRGHLRQRIKRIIEPKNRLHASRFFALAPSLALFLTAALLFNFSSAPIQLPHAARDRAQGGRKIAVGFVSIPPVDRSENPPYDSATTARLLIEQLKRHRVPAIGFVAGAGISDGEKLYPGRADIVRLWRDAGFEIGIGNFKHVWFYDTPFEEYAAGVERNERIVKQLLAEKNLQLRYFSYPFLNTGKTAEDKNRFEGWLKTRGLRSAAYTIDNQEWMYSYAYDQALKAKNVEEMKEIRAQFLDYMAKMFDHFEAYSQEMFGRDIAQTMVLTPSRLVADCSDELFGMIEKRGYRFVTMDEAQSDLAYQTKEAPVDYKSGISWFERWQMARGKKLLDEPRVNKEVWEFWNASQKKK